MVRLPGDQASANIRKAEQQGISLSEATLGNLAACAGRLGVAPLAQAC
jgi:LDH2 family malate/lactate/ureidoglycolate dehydrogenase